MVVEHLATTLAISSAIVILIRTLAVSHFDEQTTLVVLSSSDLASLIIGSVALLLPLVVPMALVMAETSPISRTGSPLVWGPVIGVVATLVIVLAPVIQVVSTFLGVVLGLIVIRRRTRGPTSMPPDRYSLSQLVLPALVGFNVIFLITYPTPWLPAERITVNGQPTSGYVLGSSGGWTTVLTDPDRNILRVRDDAITARELCNPSQRTDWDDTLAVLLARVGGRQGIIRSTCPR